LSPMNPNDQYEPETPASGNSVESFNAPVQDEQPQSAGGMSSRGRPPQLKLGGTSNMSTHSLGSTSQNAASPAGSKPLPFRQFSDTELKTPAFKTTVLPSRPGGLPRGGPRTARTPMTGVPQPPDTPYMPFTPLTPVTPHLVTKKDRKRFKKMEKSSLMDESDLVREEDEEWE
jgi:hypothetical protein